MIPSRDVSVCGIDFQDVLKSCNILNNLNSLFKKYITWSKLISSSAVKILKAPFELRQDYINKAHFTYIHRILDIPNIWIINYLQKGLYTKHNL